MKRTEIRIIINEFLQTNKITKLSAKLASDLTELLKTKFPNKTYGNNYIIECEYVDVFTKKVISGNIKRCDPIDKTPIIDTVQFEINVNLEVMVWDNSVFALVLDMSNLSNDDKIDINHINDRRSKIDVYKTFMRVKPEDRGKLADMIDNCLEIIGDDIPPYAFQNYNGNFYHTTNHAIGDIGGGVGFGGFVKQLGSIADIRATSIGEYAFDGCKHLTEVFLKTNVHFIGKNAFSNIPNLIIHCPMHSKPDTWDDDWCDLNCKVIWN